MKTITTILIYIFTTLGYSQSTYETPKKDQIPESLKDYRVAIKVENFPKENHPIKINNTYYWKHSTFILSEESEIKIIEYGAYIFYNNQWNLRRSYPLKELDKEFNTKKQILRQGQPYVWVNNWRTGDTLFGGWAMWYFIGETETGEIVCGYGTINTTDKPLKQ